MTETSTFHVVYAPERAQYVAERGELRVVPSVWPALPGASANTDTDARRRAAALCVALNRVYGVEEAPCAT